MDVPVRLIGCASRDDAADYDRPVLGVGAGPVLEADGHIPLFWLAGFDLADTLKIRQAPSDRTGGVAREFIVLCAPAAALLERLRRRRAGVVGLIAPSFARTYDQWVHFVGANYRDCLLLRTDELFAVDGDERAGLRLTAALRFMAAADSGKPIKERAAIDWLTALPDAFETRYPNEDSLQAARRWRALLVGRVAADDDIAVLSTALDAEEIAFAQSRPQAQAPRPAGTPETEAEVLARQVRHGVHADSAGDGLRLAVNKLTGAVPMGVDAPTRGLRKFLGGSAELLDVLRAGFLGLVAAVFAALLFWVGLASNPADWRFLGFGALLAAISVWLFRAAARALHRLRAIVRA